MSLACITKYFAAQLPAMIASLQNGKCRMLRPTAAGSLDANGFADSGFTPRTADFMPCVWNPKANDKNADEIIVAAQTRSRAVYEIKFAQIYQGAAVEAFAGDRIEFKNSAAGSPVVMEVLKVVNESNIVWMLYAVDITI